MSKLTDLLELGFTKDEILERMLSGQSAKAADSLPIGKRPEGED